MKEISVPVGPPVAVRPTVCGAPWVMAVVTVIEAADPAVTVVEGGDATEKSLGWALTTSVKLWVAGVPNPLLAVTVIG